MLEAHTYLCGVVTELYTALYEITAHSPDQAAEEYCLMYEGGWIGDHFNLMEGEPRTIRVVYEAKATRAYDFEVLLAEDDDNEYVISEMK